MVNFMPKTRLGQWSVGLVVLFFLLFATGIFIISRQGPRTDETFFDNPVASIPVLSAGASAIASFFTGVLSIWKYKERSIFVFVACLIVLFVLIFLLGEILVPH
jgi:cell division protein FtsW (lipid II flippase)